MMNSPRKFRRHCAYAVRKIPLLPCPEIAFYYVVDDTDVFHLGSGRVCRRESLADACSIPSWATLEIRVKVA